MRDGNKTSVITDFKYEIIKFNYLTYLNNMKVFHNTQMS